MALKRVTLESSVGLILVPGLVWIGSPPSWPVQSNKVLEKAKMADGSNKFAFFGTKRVWGMGLGFLNKTQLDLMLLQNSYSEVLKMVNNNEDATEYNIVITTFKHDPERMDVRQLERYRIEMTLEEV
jgi:hypothetical protein